MVAVRMRTGRQTTLSPNWGRWVRATTFGELAGFAVPTIAGLAVLLVWGEPRSTWGRTAFYLWMVSAGAGEGLVLGLAQSRALRHIIPGVPSHTWVRATSLAAALAWSIGMVPSTVTAFQDLPLGVQIALGGAGGLVLVNTIGVAQWLVLRPHADGAGWWAPVNMLAWLLGLLPAFVIPASLPEGAPPVVWFLGFVVAGVLMGATVGVVTGVGLVRLLRPHRGE